MFGIVFDGHPHLHRILMPRSWVGHPLRKDHPARATEMGPFQLPAKSRMAEQESLRFRPEEWGMQRSRDGSDFIFLNVGPQHPGTHGVLRIVVATRWRGDRRCRARDRLPSPRRREDGRAPVLAYLYSLHRSRGLPGRRDEQPGLSHGGGEAGGYHRSAARPGHPRDALGTVSDHQSSGLVRHVRAGSGPDVSGVLHV